MVQKTQANTWLSVITAIILIAVLGIIIYSSHNNKAETQMDAQVSSDTGATSEVKQATQMTNELKVEILKEGTGEGAVSGDTVVVNYTGTLEDGTMFDSSLKPGRTPFPVTLGQGRVIQGWEKGLLGIKVGEKRKLTIPPALGYGNQEVGGGLIPANSVLLFEVEALDIQK